MAAPSRINNAKSLQLAVAGKERHYKYKAFISYSHNADGKLAPVLQTALHNFAKPWYRLRSIRTFRDKTSLAANPALWPSIESALDDCEYFLLLASRQAARSPWVEREIQWWLQNRSIDKMLILLTDGELVWDRAANDYLWEKTTALPVGLRNQFRDEPLFVDFRWIKTEDHLSLKNAPFRAAVLDIAAPLYGKDKDALDGEDVRQHRRNKWWAWSAVVAILIAISVAFVWLYVASVERNKAFSRQLAKQAELIGKQQPRLLPQSVLLAAEALNRYPSFAADQAMYHSLSLLGPKPLRERSYQGLLDLVLSPRGRYLVQISYDGPAVVEETVSGKVIARLANVSPDNKTNLAVRRVSFSADEKSVATLSSLGMSTFVWGLPDGREIFRTPVNRGGIVAAVLSSDGTHLATGHTDGMIYLWNISKGAEVLSVSHSDPPTLIKFSPDGRFLAFSSSQGNVYGPPSITTVGLWNLSENREVAQLRHASAVTELSFSPDGQYLATTSRVGHEQDKKDRNGTVSVWKTATGDKVSRLQHDDVVNAIVFSPNGKYLLTGSSDGTSRLWDVNDGQEQLRIDHGSTVKRVAFLGIKDFAQFLATAGDDGVVRLWGAYMPVEERLRLLESPNVVAIADDPEGKYLTAISHDLKADAAAGPDQYRRDVRVWSVASIRAKLRLPHEHAVGGLGFSPDGRYLATFDFQMPNSQLISGTAGASSRFRYTDSGIGNASIWEVSTRQRLARLPHPGTVMSIDYDGTGKHLATACVDGIVRVFGIPGGDEAANLKREGWIYQVRFSPNGQYIAAASGKPELLEGKKGRGQATIWEWRTGREVGFLQSDHLIAALAFSPDGNFLAAGGSDGTVHLLRATDAQEVQRLSNDDPIWALAYSPDGRYLAAASGGLVTKDSHLQQGQTTLWSVNDNSKRVLRDHKSWALTVDFSPDGTLLASMDQDGEIGMWSLAEGHELANIKHDGYAPQVKIRFSPDSRYLATAFGDEAQIWEASTGNEIARRQHQRGSLWDIAFSPNGEYLATASTDTTVGLWLWRPKELVAEACNRLNRNLTDDEWRLHVGAQSNYRATCANLRTSED